MKYAELSEDLKKEIKSKMSLENNLNIGFYSKLYQTNDDNKIIKYRFQKNKNTTLNIVFNSDTEKHKPFLNKNNILFYDSDLKNTLEIDKNIFEENIHMNLSDEQKEDLMLGRDITLNVEQKKSNIKKTETKNMKSSFIKKAFVCDFSFFLSKNSIMIKEKIKKPISIHLINS